MRVSTNKISSRGALTIRWGSLLLAMFLCNNAFAASEKAKAFPSLHGLMAVHPEIKALSRIHLGDALSGNPRACLMNLASLATSSSADPLQAGIAQVILGLASRPNVSENFLELSRLLGAQEAAAVSEIAKELQKPAWTSLREQAQAIKFSNAHSNLGEALAHWDLLFDAARKDPRSPVLEDDFADDIEISPISKPLSSATGNRHQIDLDRALFVNDIVGTRVYDATSSRTQKSHLARLATLTHFGIAKISRGKIAEKAVHGLVEDLNSSDPKVNGLAARLLPKLGGKATQPLIWELGRRDTSHDRSSNAITQKHNLAEILAILGNIKDLNLIDEIAPYLSHPDSDAATAASNAIETIRSRVADSDSIIAMKLAAGKPSQVMTQEKKEFNAFYSKWHYRYPARPDELTRYRQHAAFLVCISLMAFALLNIAALPLRPNTLGRPGMTWWIVMNIISLLAGTAVTVYEYRKESLQLAWHNWANRAADAAEKRTHSIAHADDILKAREWANMGATAKQWTAFKFEIDSEGQRHGILPMESRIVTSFAVSIVTALIAFVVIVTHTATYPYLIGVPVIGFLIPFVLTKKLNALRAAQDAAADAFEQRWGLRVDAGKLPTTFEEMAKLKHKQTPPNHLTNELSESSE